MTEWRPVAGWEASHEVSDDGQVRSIPRKGVNGQRGTAGYILRQKVDGPAPGYLTVALCFDKKRTYGKKVHKLVAVAFLGPCPPGQEVRHGPKGRFVNSIDNLCYGTRKENMADTLRDGTRAQGSRHGGAVLTEEIVIECRRRYAEGGISHRMLALKYGVTRETMRDAINGKYWSHVA